MASMILLPLLLLATAPPPAWAAIDVVQMLADKPKYAMFAKLLDQSRVAAEVNRLRSVSLLVVPDRFVQPLMALPADKQRAALANHVLMEYSDPVRLGEIKSRTAVLRTLLSLADKRNGAIVYNQSADGQMYLNAPGNPCVGKLVKVIAARPVAVCIMEVSELLLPAGYSTAPCAKKGDYKAKGKLKTLAANEGSMRAAPSQAPPSTR
ncbi:hypothetical protein ACP4OV_028182 [Aristida adscensionis]